MSLIESQNQQRNLLSNCRYAALNKFTPDPEWLTPNAALTHGRSPLVSSVLVGI